MNGGVFSILLAGREIDVRLPLFIDSPQLSGKEAIMAAATVRAKVLAGNKKFMAAFGQKNAAALAKCYTKGGQLLSPASEVVTGREGIQAFWQGALDMGLVQVKLDTVEVESHRDTAIEVGKYTLVASGGQVADAGKYVVIWKIEGRSWKLHRDIWNSSQPCPVK